MKEEKHYKENKDAKESPSQESNQETLPHQVNITFSETEIKSLLFGIFRGKDNAQGADSFLQTHKGCGRTKASLKTNKQTNKHIWLCR